MKKMIFAATGVLLLSLSGGGGVWLWKTGYLSTEMPAQEEDIAEEVTGENAPRRGAMELVRKLTATQDQIAIGNLDAAHQQNDLHASIVGEFSSLSNHDWRSARNFQAMIGYVLSGGRTEVVRRYLEMKIANAKRSSLAKGALSFALGKPKTALKQFGDLDVRTLERPLVGVVAVALATLHAPDDATRGVQLYDEARLYAPSTSIEEAALRREVPLLVKTSDIGRLNALTSRYVRVFGKSPFASSFYAEAANALSSLDEKQSSVIVEAVSASLAEENVELKTNLFLHISRAALLSGKVVLAKTAADIVIGMLPESSPAREKARFYAAAALAPTDRAANAEADLDAVAANNLDADDNAIRDAARKVAQNVANAGAAEVRLKSSNTAERGTGNENAEETASDQAATAIDRANSALKNADALLSIDGTRAVQ